MPLIKTLNYFFPTVSFIPNNDIVKMKKDELITHINFVSAVIFRFDKSFKLLLKFSAGYFLVGIISFFGMLFSSFFVNIFLFFFISLLFLVKPAFKLFHNFSLLLAYHETLNNFANPSNYSSYKNPTSLKYFKDAKSKVELKKEFRRLSNIYHPDKPNGDAEIFKSINNEYSILKNKLA